ncbi:MAG: hypothetical protein HOA84_05615 [Candidatus Jacksonbacteria bacterium]|nr:hypothetical protein [Candidatus Jacksonbacteria bacterium]
MQNHPKKNSKLTKKQQGFVNDYVEDENGTRAALKNYNIGGKGGSGNINTAATIAKENLTKPQIMQAIEVRQKSLREALGDEGVTPEKIAEKVNVLLEAKQGKKPDTNAIDKGLKHATNIYGVEDAQAPSKNNTYNFIFNPSTQEEIRELEDKIKDKLKNAQPN